VKYQSRIAVFGGWLHPLPLLPIEAKLRCPAALFGSPATSLLQRSMGFAPPPRGGFAFVASPERHSACELSY